MSDVVEIRAPAEQTEGTRSQVLRWLKSVGDHVEASEPLLELETDKVTIEIPAPSSGLLQKILKVERQDVNPGELLGELGSVLPSQQVATGDGAAPVETAEPHSIEGSVPAPQRRRLSPAVRRLLREHALEGDQIQGTGRNGRITAQDVQRHLTGQCAGSSESTTQSAAADNAALQARDHARETLSQGVRRIPHSAMRQRVAEHMVRSLLQTAPHVTTVFEADLSAVLAHRRQHREVYARQGADLTLTAYFVAAAVAAIRTVPEANARWTDTALEISDVMNIGIATALDRKGLIVPVLKGVETLSLLGIAKSLGMLVRKAREGTLTPDEVQGGTFTISNHGVSGSLVATPIVIPQPQSAILGVGKLEKRVVVREIEGADHIAIRPMCYVTLTIDHRVMDGYAANTFLQVFTATLERWPADDR